MHKKYGKLHFFYDEIGIGLDLRVHKKKVYFAANGENAIVYLLHWKIQNSAFFFHAK